MKKNRFISIALSCTMLIGFSTACNMSSIASDGDGNLKKIVMVTDTGGVNDMSFNQSAWEGLNKFHSLNPDIAVNYVESSQESDFESNLDIAVDSGAQLVYGIGYNLLYSIENIARLEPDTDFVIFDSAIPDENLTRNLSGVSFRSEEGSFLVGCIAAMMTQTNKVGFVGGQEGFIVGQFQYGYEAGVEYMAKKLGKNIDHFHQYTESFSDSAKGKSIANKMISQGADIIFHAAGGCGVGVIQAATDAGKYAIGCDTDQSSLSPDNVLTSCIKNIGKACGIIAEKRINEGKNFCGKNFLFGADEDVIGIPEDNKNIPDEVLKSVDEIKQKLLTDEIIVPNTLQDYEKYVNQLDR